jgi:hypothetical protein
VSFIVAWQRPDRNIAVANNTEARTGELLDAPFSMRARFYEKKVCDYSSPKSLILFMIYGSSANYI